MPPRPSLKSPEEIAALNLGSASAAQSAAPAAPVASKPPSGPPPGFDTSRLDTTVTARPTPPANYTPGYTAPVRQEYEESPLFKLGMVLQGFATPAGELPPVFKLRLAQQKMDLEASQNKLAWDNYYQTNQTLEVAAKEHNRSAMFKAFEMMPQFKGHLASIDDPATRERMGNWYGKMLDSLAPGLGDVMRTMGTNPSRILGFDHLLKDTGPIGKGFRELTKGRSYEELAKDPAVHKLLELHGRDTIPVIISRMSNDDRARLANKGIKEDEFTQLFVEAAKDASFQNTPQDIAYARSLLSTDFGQASMAQHGVQLNSTALKQQEKSKDDPIKAGAHEEYLAAKAKLNDPKATPSEKEEAKDLVARYHGTKAKELETPDNPNSPVNQRFSAKAMEAGIAARNLGDVEKLPDGPVKKHAIKLWQEARKEQDQASPMGSLAAKMATPGDTSNYVMAEDLRTRGEVVPVRDNVSAGELLGNKKYLKITPEQRKELRDLKAIVSNADNIFRSAREALTPDITGSVGAVTAEAVLAAEDNPFTANAKAIAKASHPKLAVYVAERERTLGKFARAVSGEMGVLTDQDTGRVRNMFPSASDTPDIITAKEKSLKALVALNRKLAAEILAGELSPEEADVLKRSDKYRSAVNGIFGGAEGAGKGSKTGGTGGTGDTGGTGSAEPKKSPADALLEKMKAEKAERERKGK